MGILLLANVFLHTAAAAAAAAAAVAVSVL
jgi:hypothetical protein